MTARLLVKQADGVHDRPPSELSDVRGTPAWLDIVHPDGSEMALIAEELGLHPLAVEDARERHERPKVDAYAGYYDHVVRVTDEIDTLRDLVSNVVDTNLAAVSNRLNEAMRVLTALATILLVMPVVTGFFGQNFVAFIPYDSAAAFWGSIAFMVVSALALVAYFRRKRWLEGMSATRAAPVFPIDSRRLAALRTPGGAR